MTRTLSENFTPYTSIGNMLLILNQIKKGWVPSLVDKGEMERVGITAGNVSRTISALGYFGLTDENDKPTDTWKAIATSTSNDYPKVLEGILRNAYPSIFQLHPNPADATDVELDNAFAKSEPLNQRSRMVSLFRGLCQEAGLIAGDPITRDRNQNSKQSANTFEWPNMKINPSLKWYNDLDTLMSRLPNPANPQWTTAEKERWLTALQSMLDLLIEVVDEKS